MTDDQPVAEFPPPTETPEVLQQHFLPDHITALASNGWLVVPDSRGRVRWAYKQFPGPDWQGWHLLMLVAAATPLEYLSFLRREGIPYLLVGDRRVDLEVALKGLRDRLDVRTVVSTGGGHLNGALLRAGLLDEIEVERPLRRCSRPPTCHRTHRRRRCDCWRSSDAPATECCRATRFLVSRF